MITRPLRRQILAILDTHPGVSRAELAELLAATLEMAAWDADQLELSLHHNYLPRFDSEGYVEYDHRSGDVTLGENAELVLADSGDN